VANQDRAHQKRMQIAEANGANLCPQCARPLSPRPVSSGAMADGLFCGLDCLVTFHADYFAERARASSPSQN
jgi:hypothetical protein